jgi:hypothetical protein
MLRDIQKQCNVKIFKEISGLIKELEMSNTCPDKWVILEFTSEKYGKFRKILSSWFGGYLDGDSWKLSSLILKINEKGNYYEIVTESSIYECYKNLYGMSTYTYGVYNNLLDAAKKNSITLVVIEECLI